MKKQYIYPAMAVIKIHTPQILAGSDPALSGDYTGGEILSREGEDLTF